MATNNRNKKRRIQLRLSDEGHRNLAKLAEALGTDRGQAVEAAVMVLLLEESCRRKSS
jgi:uncharacterized protein (DUF1778 family)